MTNEARFKPRYDTQLERHKIVGYETFWDPSYPLAWGAAALRCEHGIYNACLPPGAYIDDEHWSTLTHNRVVTPCEEEFEVAVPLAGTSHVVVSLRADLLDRKPYQLHEDGEDDLDFARKLHGVVAVHKAATRGYYVFETYGQFEKWIRRLHVGPYILTEVGT